MKKILKNVSVWSLCFVAASLFSLSACSKPEEETKRDFVKISGVTYNYSVFDQNNGYAILRFNIQGFDNQAIKEINYFVDEANIDFGSKLGCIKSYETRF